MKAVVNLDFDEIDWWVVGRYKVMRDILLKHFLRTVVKVLFRQIQSYIIMSGQVKISDSYNFVCSIKF